MSQPAISVVTVTWNLIEAGRQDTIREAIKSVQDQTCRTIEHVIWDGASDDGTQALLEGIIAGYAEKPDHIPIRYESLPDSGLYEAMNQAVGAASGKYVIFLNSDDLLGSAECLKKMLAAVGTADPDFVYGQTVFLNSDGSTRLARRLTLRSILQRMPFGHNAVLIRKAMFEELGGHDLGFRSVADYDFLLRMVLAGRRGMRIMVPVSVFRHGGISADIRKAAREMAQCWKKNYATYADMEAYSEEDCIGWYRKGQLPMRLSLAILIRSIDRPVIARAALYSLGVTLRRRLQPWRRWDNFDAT